MKPSDLTLHRFRAQGFCAALLVLAAAAARAGADVPEDDAWPESRTVRELLRLDAAAALAERRARFEPELAPPAPGPASEAGAAVRDRVRVAAIYGVGAGLRAEVRINDALRVYRAGRKAAEGRQQAGDGYGLVAISGACVTLEGPGGPVTACLEPAAHDGEG